MSIGRPTRFTPQIGKTLCDMIRKGVTPTVAIKCLGIGRSSVTRWIEKGKARPGSMFGAFRSDYEIAKANRERVLEEAVLKCAEGYVRGKKVEVKDGQGNIVEVREEAWKEYDGRTALEALARLRPKRWGRKDNVPLILAAGAGSGNEAMVAPAELARRMFATVGALGPVPKDSTPAQPDKKDTPPYDRNGNGNGRHP